LRLEQLGRELATMFDRGTRPISLAEVQGQQPTASSRTRRSPLLLGAAVFVVVVVAGVALGELNRPDVSAPSSTEPDVPLGGPVLPPAELGFDHLWPTDPVGLMPAELGEVFAAETLRWASPAASEFAVLDQGDVETDGTPHAGTAAPPLDEMSRARVHQPGVEELVDVITRRTEDGYVITDVGPPWFVGVQIFPSGPGGTRIHLLRIGDDVTGEVTALLRDGTYIVVSKTISVGIVDSTFVDLPDVRPEDVRSVLIRYVDAEGNVIAANGAGALSVSSDE